MRGQDQVGGCTFSQNSSYFADSGSNVYDVNNCYGSTGLGQASNGNYCDAYGFLTNGQPTNPLCYSPNVNYSPVISAPASSPAPVATPPTCDLTIEHWGLYGMSLLPAHGYLYFTSSRGYSRIIEGYDETGNPDKLRAQDDSVGLAADNPANDTRDYSISGQGICNDINILDAGVNKINAANINYNLLGPNSNSVLRYLSSTLGITLASVPLSLIGYNARLPGVE